MAAKVQETDNNNTIAGTLSIVLAGNPNVGKSVIFNALTGANADVSNYPGTTIDISSGKLGLHDIADTPGVYGISSFNDEERAARRMILEAQVIVNVVSALTLERDLFLTLQLIDLQKPMFVVVNQWDEALARGMEIDLEYLKESLGLKVFACVATASDHKGLDEIKESLIAARKGIRAEETTLAIQKLKKAIGAEKLATTDDARLLMLAEDDSTTFADLGLEPASTLDGTPLALRSDIYKARRAKVDEIVKACVKQRDAARPFSYHLGKFLLHPVFGSAIALSVCYFIFYQVLGVWIAGNLVDLTEKKGMKVYYEPQVRRLAAFVFPARITIGDKIWDLPQGTQKLDETSRRNLDADLAAHPLDQADYDFWHYHDFMGAIGNILVGPYGLATLTVTYLLGLLMPLVVGFYLGLALLEDSGYLPRLAVLVDRAMNKMGLNGRAIIPLILGLGCVTMATITTRLLTSRREKIIATALLGIAIPCSAQLGVVSGTLAAAGGLKAWAVYGTIITLILGTSGLLLNMLMPGKSMPLMIDLPPMRLPRASNVLKKTWKKSSGFLLDAVPMFFIAGFAVTIAQMSGLLDLMMRVLAPIVVHWLLLPADPRIPTTFILGIVRRDFAAFGLTDVALTPSQAVVAMVVITLFVPCIATVGVMIKERGPKIALTIWFGSWIAAIGLGGLLARTLPLLGIL